MKVQRYPLLQAHEFESLYPTFPECGLASSAFMHEAEANSSMSLAHLSLQNHPGGAPPDQQIKTLRHTLKISFFEALSALLATLNAKDSALYQHSIRVRHFSHILTGALNLPQEEQAMIELGALFHDIGKIAILDNVLQKTSRLTTQEYEHMKEHCQQGALILNHIGALNKVASVALHHHERWDGAGYPTGLAGEAIPLGARIVAIADAYEVMTSQRIYQAARTSAQAIEELYLCAGKQFDAKLVMLFCSLLASLPTAPQEATEQASLKDLLVQMAS